MTLRGRGIPTRRVSAWILGAAMVAAPGIAQAANFEVGDVSVSTSTTFSLGTSFRVSGQDCEYISAPNGGCANSLGVTNSVNNDDGNINTEGGQTISRVAKVTAEADISWRNMGAFVRGTAFFDFWADNQLGKTNTRFGRRPLKDSARGDDARDAARSDAEILDAFVYANFDAGSVPVSLRVGNQVVNWGESLFIPGGVNAYLPVDVAALRTPGSEVKEALKPQPSVYASLGLPYDLSLEGFYVFGFEESDLDPCGTFFAGHDGYCDGGAYVQLNNEFPNAVTVPRTFDRDADDQGQFGVALRYYADWLNDGTELAFYFNRYHSKLPIATFTAAADTLNLGAVTGNPGLNGVNVSSASQFCGALLGLIAQANTFANCANPANGQALGLSTSILTASVGASALTKEGYAVYVEDIESWGMSFNTLVNVLGGTALAGEVSYTPNMPFQLADPEINANDVEKNALDDYAAGLPDGTLPDNTIVRSFGTLVTNGGQEIRGYDEYGAMTAQLQTTSTFPSSDPITSFIEADTIIFLSNVGAQYLPDLGDNSRLGAARSGAGHDVALADSILGQGVGFTNYADDFSWGYRLVAIAQYNNAFNTSWTVSPSIQFGHDVKGNSAGPIGPGFLEHKKALTLRVNADLEDTWQVGVAYTNNFGAREYNQLNDKDFLSVNASYSF